MVAGVVSVETWVKRVQAFIRGGVGKQKMLVCRGPHGIGKTSMTVQACKDLGLSPVVCPGLGAQQPEDFLPIVRAEEAGVQMYAMPNVIPDAGGAAQGVIPWIIDECLTGTPMQYNQLRAALTLRQIGGLRIPDNVVMIGTTNPADGRYTSVHEPDAALLDRMEIIDIYMPFNDHMAFLRGVNAPEKCITFLAANEQLWHAQSPRFWHERFCGTWEELHANGRFNDAEVQALMTAACGDGSATWVADFMDAGTQAQEESTPVMTLGVLFVAAANNVAAPWKLYDSIVARKDDKALEGILCSKKSLGDLTRAIGSAPWCPTDFIPRLLRSIDTSHAEKLRAVLRQGADHTTKAVESAIESYMQQTNVQ